MAAYNQRLITSIRHEYTLDAPAHWSELEKAVDAARRDWAEASESRRGDVTVSGVDDELIVVSWTQEDRL